MVVNYVLVTTFIHRVLCCWHPCVSCSSRVIKFVYTVKAAGVALSLEVEDGVSFANLQQAFRSISVTGVTATSYGDLALDVSTLGRLVDKSSLSYIVVTMPVLQAHYAGFKTALENTWTALGEILLETLSPELTFPSHVWPNIHQVIKSGWQTHGAFDIKLYIRLKCWPQKFLYDKNLEGFQSDNCKPEYYI